MKLSLIKAEGYAGLRADCKKCRKLVEIPFSKLPDEELEDVKAKLICSVCGERPKVEVYRDQTLSMGY